MGGPQGSEVAPRCSKELTAMEEESTNSHKGGKTAQGTGSAVIATGEKTPTALMVQIVQVEERF